MCCPCARNNLKQFAVSAAVLAAWAGLALTIMLATFADKVWITKDLSGDNGFDYSQAVHFEDGGKALFSGMIIFDIVWCVILILVAVKPQNTGIQMTNVILSAIGFVVQLVAGIFMFVMAAAVDTDSPWYGASDKLKNPQGYFISCYIPAIALCCISPVLAHGSRLQRIASLNGGNTRGVMANTQGGYVQQQYSQQPPPQQQYVQPVQQPAYAAQTI